MSQTQVRTTAEVMAEEQEKPRYRRQINWWLTALIAFVSLSILFPFISALFVPFAIVMLPIAKETAMLGLDNRLGLIFLYIILGATDDRA